MPLGISDRSSRLAYTITGRLRRDVLAIRVFSPVSYNVHGYDRSSSPILSCSLRVSNHLKNTQVNQSIPSLFKAFRSGFITTSKLSNILTATKISIAVMAFLPQLHVLSVWLYENYWTQISLTLNICHGCLPCCCLKHFYGLGWI